MARMSPKKEMGQRASRGDTLTIVGAKGYMPRNLTQQQVRDMAYRIRNPQATKPKKKPTLWNPFSVIYKALGGK